SVVAVPCTNTGAGERRRSVIPSRPPWPRILPPRASPAHISGLARRYHSRLPRRRHAMPARLPYTGNDEADELLSSDPLALLVGFALDQQVTVQKAFSGPWEMRRRLGRFDARTIAAMDPAELDRIFRATGDPPLPW